MSRLNFALDARAAGSKARAGRFRTLHGEVLTPVFMPVGTQATVKGLTVDQLSATGARVLLANTYHLLLRPGPEVFKKFGGIHRFMKWDGPVLTDSGGFQIFSLPHARRLDEEGARFQSYVDGTTHLLSPEASIDMQKAIGSDIMMVLDQCIPSTAPLEVAREAMELTHRWAGRSLAARGDSPQALFGIVQGACHPDLRKQSAAFLRDLPFDGLAIGGLAVGETDEERHRFTDLVTGELPEDRPRYLMGVGTPLDLLEAVHRGVDMFDCIIPSQVAARGMAFTSRGKLQFRRSVYKFSEETLDPDCDCQACRGYSRAYLHHLTKANESLGGQLLTVHNLTFYRRLMAGIRDAILRGDFLAFYEKTRLDLMRSDEENPCEPTPPRHRKAPRPGRLGDYEIRDSPLGFSSVVQTSSGETMHSVNPPDEEAERLYVGQSFLAKRLADGGAPGRKALVVWDVGLGAATNAMAAVRCYEALFSASPASLRALHLVSFERDLDPLRLALGDPGRFRHLRHGAPHELLQNHAWKHGGGQFVWDLHLGDFAERFVEAPVPDLIYYDPFSSKSDGALWAPELFTRLAAHCRGTCAELYTYSASTAVRAALLAAGFFVAEGIATGPKATTTLAFAQAEGAAVHPMLPKLLGARWLERWSRSGSKFPPGIPDAEKAAFAGRIETHPQFALPENAP
ncbi:MAG: tRNA guanosine(34) transglycosylase Tgt [Spirochaetes bacterium]|nr:tRNA guanosine(34) transglycosylase Tgt [Spirochaetota bacterium]